MCVPAIQVTDAPYPSNGYAWSIIADCGRILVALGDTFTTDIEAFNAGKAWRTAWMEHTRHIDHGE